MKKTALHVKQVAALMEDQSTLYEINCHKND